ncbi:hypothetical protein OS493_034796 [Desmophyllum pertusum]|uniref:Protein kinase domain-containing protein n=1 Tax=Desmophyllum pertusum TaxID=174260 RepID=A0A9X0CJF4_9CNID|nr:hypothetical protein OS493_034796 [Desmophyllum pertusum]
MAQSASNDCGSCNLVDSVTDVTRLQELPSVHEALDQVEEDFTFPSPPKDSPHSPNQADNAAVSATVLTDVVDSRSSLSSTSLDRYYWSSASSNLPSQSLHEYEERLISPLQDEFSVTDQFEENIQYSRLDVEIGSGAFGKCYLAAEVPADDTVEGRVFCVKMASLI